MPPALDLYAAQVRIGPRDYESADGFAEHMEALVRQIDAQRPRAENGSPIRPALAVFPENIGTFLALEGVPLALTERLPRTEAALGLLAARHPVDLAWACARRRSSNLSGALLLARGRRMHEIYHATFSHLAREHRLAIVAGSILLPENALGPEAPILEERSGDVYNLSYVFDERGLGIAVVKKVHLEPTLEDRLGLSPGEPGQVGPISAAWGRFATLICYDGFCEPYTRGERFEPLSPRLDRLGVDVFAQPAANSWPWDSAWAFADPGEHILRREQWRREGVAAALAACTRTRFAVTAHLCGRMFERSFEGRSEILARGRDGAVRVLAQAPRIDGEAIVRATVEL
ncbi:MAG TPA: carbon-nitrogen hydrolase family protein [Polyangia bacterium]|nr:carbon-nitrogen hydrolase family protein [Polyangia bacterium]